MGRWRQVFTRRNTGQIWMPAPTTEEASSPILPHLHYKLDESAGASASDESANSYTGTLQNMEDGDWGTGSLGNALTFGGTDEDILVNHATAGDFEWDEPFTVNFRIKHTQTGLQSIMSKVDLTSGVNRGWLVYISAGYVVFQLTDSALTSAFMYVYNTVDDLNDGAWHKVSFTYNGNGLATGMTMYVDGAFRATTVGADALGAPTTIKHSALMHIGSDDSAGNFLVGSVDEVRLDTVCMSSTQVLAIHNDGSPVTESTVEDLHMLFDETSGGTAEDQSTNRYSGVGSNITWGAGKIDNAATFNGTNSFLDLGHVLNYEYTDPFSVAFWYKGTATGANESVIIKMRSAGDYRGWRIKVNASNVLQFQLLGTTGDCQVHGQNSIRDGSWNHCIITYDGSGDVSGVEMYVNNAGETESDVVNTLAGNITDITEKCFIGVYEGIGERLNAAIDDLRVIPGVLTSSQRAFLYNSGSGTQAALSA